MEVSTDLFCCLWCAVEFARRHPVGRKPHYCSATCRQRAYEERRRGARFPAHPRPRPVAPARSTPPRYESGRNGPVRHALRPAGLPDRHRRRQTLCGTWAAGIRPPWGTPAGRPAEICHMCEQLAQRFPARRAIDPPVDLAVLTHLISRLPPHADHGELFSYCALDPWPPRRHDALRAAEP